MHFTHNNNNWYLKANKVFYDVVLQKEFSLHGGATIEVTSSDESIFSNEGILNKPLYETPIELALLVKIPSLGVEKIIKETVYAQPLTIQEKCEKVEQWIKENVSKDGYLYKDAVLPKYPFLHHWKLSLKQPKDYW